jgi:hypothetical protein
MIDRGIGLLLADRNKEDRRWMLGLLLMYRNKEDRWWKIHLLLVYRNKTTVAIILNK